MVQSDVEDAVGNVEAFLNGSRRSMNTCAGVVPSTSAGKRAAVSACLFSGLCLPSAWREAPLALPYGLLNELHPLLSRCWTVPRLLALLHRARHSSAPLLGPNSLHCASAGWLLSVLSSDRLQLQKHHCSGPSSDGQKWPFSVVVESFGHGNGPRMKMTLACPSLLRLLSYQPRSCTILLFRRAPRSRGHL